MCNSCIHKGYCPAAGRKDTYCGNHMTEKTKMRILEMKKSKQARAREFSNEERQKIVQRDRYKCIFCAAGFKTDGATYMALNLHSIMHYIPRSKNGLGIAQNGALGCQYHHDLMDNGNKGKQKEMLEFFKEYLMSKYEDWNESELVYTKWNF